MAAPAAAGDSRENGHAVELADPLLPRPAPPPGGRGTAHPGLPGLLTVLGPISTDLYRPGPAPDVAA